MLMMLAALLVILWVVGLATSYTFGGFINALLVAALALILVKVFRDRRPAAD